MAAEEFVVHGTVTDDNGCSVAHAEVAVCQQRLRDRWCLAEGRADEEGRYRLAFQCPEDLCGRLLVVVAARGKSLAKSIESLPFEAQAEQQVDLAARPRDQSEYSRLVAAIRPHIEGLELVDLVENDAHQDLSFLARKIDRSPEAICQIVIAARVAASLEIPAPLFYAFLRLHVPAGLPQSLFAATERFTRVDVVVKHVGSLVCALTPDTQRQTIERAVAGNIIDSQFRREVDALVTKLQTYRTADALAQPYQRGQATLAQLLDAAGLPEDKHSALAEALLTSAQPMSAFWSTTEGGHHGITSDEAASVHRTLEVGALIDNHLPLLKTLLQGFDDGTYTSSSPTWRS